MIQAGFSVQGFWAFRTVLFSSHRFLLLHRGKKMVGEKLRVFPTEGNLKTVPKIYTTNRWLLSVPYKTLEYYATRGLLIFAPHILTFTISPTTTIRLSTSNAELFFSR